MIQSSIPQPEKTYTRGTHKVAPEVIGGSIRRRGARESAIQDSGLQVCRKKRSKDDLHRNRFELVHHVWYFSKIWRARPAVFSEPIILQDYWVEQRDPSCAFTFLNDFKVACGHVLLVNTATRSSGVDETLLKADKDKDKSLVPGSEYNRLTYFYQPISASPYYLTPRHILSTVSHKSDNSENLTSPRNPV